ncbi:MAG: glutaredoxin family protein [Aquabacterium sp.]|jgi:glutaredoxin|uniref:glutaredoxin family protein n=1 Tax=Aquabacterium sp. TaxID=1872578 RepID=UPI002A36E6C0|nr:glutaredoxin family protein [Aquabacterium sp.]MDX9842270.1 glutaredoxin family protein [Aquabacterium sp.]
MNRIVVSALISGLAWAGVSSPAWAQYKVVGPDGRITYTDRPPVDRPAQPVKSSGSAGSNAALPYALGKVVASYPVTLYTGSNCAPCDAGRNLLKSRGIPFTEKTVNTSDDARALQSREGTNQVPVIRIGSKQIAGFEQGEWTSYLDAAGYPSQSALPPTYRHPAATPLAPAAAPQPEPEAAGTLPPPQFNTAPGSPAGNAPPGFRF